MMMMMTLYAQGSHCFITTKII